MKKVLLLIFSFLLLSSVSATSLTPTQYFTTPSGYNEIDYIYRLASVGYVSSPTSFYKATFDGDTFGSSTLIFSTGLTKSRFGILENNTKLLCGNPTNQYTILFGNAGNYDSNIYFWETNMVSGYDNIVTIALNDYTPAEHHILRIKDGDYDNKDDYFYVLYNDTTTDYINVYTIGCTGAVYDVSYVTTIELDNYCSQTKRLHTDSDYIYVSCSYNDTIRRFNKLGDLQETYYLSEGNDDTNALFTYNSSFYARHSTSGYLYEYPFTPIETLYPLIDGYYRNLTGYCINEDYECNDTIVTYTNFNVPNFVCASTSNKHICTNGCTNTLLSFAGNQILSAECEQLPCNNECDVVNEYVCTTQNTYSICSLGIDGCTDLTEDYYCSKGLYCTDGQCDNVSINKTGLWTQEGITINGRLNTTNAYEKKEQTAELYYDIASYPASILSPKLNKKVKAFYMKTVQKFLSTTIDVVSVEQVSDFYKGVSCDFTNKLLEEDYLQHANLLGRLWTTTEEIENTGSVYYLRINNSNAVKTLTQTTLSEEVEIMIKPQTTSYTTIQYKNNEYENGELYIDYNSTSKQLLIGETNYGKIFVNETSLQPTDDLQRIVIVSQHLEETSLTNYEIYVIRKPLTTDVISRTFTLPIGYTNIQAISPNKINITTNGIVDVYQILQWEQDGFPAYENSDTNPYSTCEYTQATCKNVRVFGNNQNIPTYHFYQDLQVCATQLESIRNIQLEEQANGNNTITVFGTEIKNFSLKLALIILFAIIGFTFYISGEMDNTSQKNAVIIIGTIMFGLTMFYFVSINVIPAWVIALLIIIGGGLTVLMVRRGMQ